MNSLRFFLMMAILTVLSVGVIFSQAVGDYGSLGTGNWGTTGANWLVCQTAGTWGDATAASGNPTAATNVWIRTGHTVTVEASGKLCLNLTIEPGASLVGDLPLPTSSIRYVRVSGTTATINGVFGATAAPGTCVAMEAATTGGTLTITGSGTFGPSRVRMNSAASGATIVFDMNTTFWYKGSSGTGGVGLYPQTDNNTFTINAGKTLTFVNNSGLSVSSGNGTSTGQSLTVNVYGTIGLSSDSSALTLRVTTGKTATFHIYPGGSVSVGGNVSTSTVADGGSTSLIVDGSMTVGGNVDFSNPAFVVTGSGSFTVPAATNLMIGHVDGITPSGSTGQIQTTTRSFSSGAGYAFAGSAAQVTGTGMPSSVGKLTGNNAAGVTLTNSTTVNDSLILTSGSIVTGANTLTVVDTGGVSRTSGFVVGTLRKGIPVGAGVSRTFEVGTGSTYAPVDVAFAVVSTAGILTGKTTAGDHPNLSTATIDPAKSVNRYWTLTNGGVVFDSCTVDFNFAAGDIDGGANPGSFIIERYNGSIWSGLNEGTRTGTSTQATGVTAFSDFAIGEPMGAPPAPGFELSSNSLNLGSTTVGTSKVDSVFVRNIGTATLNVSSILSNNAPVFTVAPASATVLAGDSAKVTVTFTPSSSGSASGSITFTHNATGSPSSLSVSGTGVPAAPVVSNGIGGGDWSSTSTWQGGIVPTRLDSVIVLGADSVYVLADSSCSGLWVRAGGRLALYDTLTVRVNTGVDGKVIAQAGGRMTITTGGSAIFRNGSVYQHARDGGSMPTATWAIGSTFMMTGLIAAAPGSGNQNFYNIIWNCPAQTATVNLGWNNITIGGNITIPTTGTGRWQMCAPVTDSSATVTINGDVTFAAGNFTTNGTSNGNTTIVIHHYGNIIVTGGNFAISRGSQGGTGTTRWYLYNGDFTMTNATTQNSNSAGARFVFAKAGTQVLTLSAVTFSGNGMPFEINGGTTLNMGTSVLGGSGQVIIDAGATLQSGNSGGMDSTLAGTGTRTLDPGSNYTFNGSVPQRTGRPLPDILNNLTISNASGVTLSDSIVVNGIVSLTNGDLDLNGKMITLGPSGLLSETTGNTLTGTGGVITATRTLNAPSSSTDIAGLGVGIGSSVNLGSTVITRGPAIQAGAGSGSIKRYFDVIPTTNTGLNATLVFKYDDSELNAIPEASLALFKSTDNGTSWVSAAGTVNTTSNTITLSGLNDLSRWTAAASGPPTVNINIPIAAAWNLISNPVTNPIPGDSVRQLYPTSSNAYAFEFAAGYVQKFRLANGKGYWEKFPAAISQLITGTARTRDSISVVAGWNIVGTISNPVDTNTIVSVPPGLRASQWFGYAAGYTPVTQLIPGKGYWLKSSAAGKFVLANPLVSGPAKAQASGESALDALNTLTITDSRGGSQMLYFGADAKNEIQLPMFVMPPAPPAGALDARFETAEGGSMVRTHAVKVSEAVEYSIAVQSEAYPLTVSWKINGGTASYELTDGLGGRVFAAKEMTGEGSIRITNSDVNKFSVKLIGDGQLPTDFALSQNYPNPFNPTTSIKYALPVESKLTMEIYNVIGQRVRTLLNDVQVAGYHVAEWDGTGNGGQQLASGVYFLQISAKGMNGKSFNDVRKLVMMK